MARGRPCKICKLKESNPKAYAQLSGQISKNEKRTMAKFLRGFNEEHGLEIILMNVKRHKDHSEPKQKEKEKKLPPEMTIYSSEGDVQYTNIEEIKNKLNKEHKLFCEAYIVEFNGTRAYLSVYQHVTVESAGVLASKLLRNVSVKYYIDYLISIREREVRVDRVFIIEKLKENLERALAEEPVTDKLGEPTGFYIYNGAVANKAIELLSRHVSMPGEKGVIPREQLSLYNDIVQKLLLNQINPLTAGYELDKLQLPIPEGLKTAMRKVDPKMIEPPKLTSTDDIDVDQLSDEELDQIILQGVE